MVKPLDIKKKHVATFIFTLCALLAFFPSNFAKADSEGISVYSEANVTSAGLIIDFDDSEASFTATPLNGLQQIKTTAISRMYVSDMTGMGKGWRVDVTADPVRSGNQVLPANALRMNPIKNVVKHDPTSSDIPVITTSALVTLGSTPVTILKADPGKGMGSYLATMGDLSLTVPAGAYAGTYTTSLGFSIITAP